MHLLKHEEGANQKLYVQIQKLIDKDLGKTLKENLQASVTYYKNHRHQMHCSQY